MFGQSDSKDGPVFPAAYYIINTPVRDRKLLLQVHYLARMRDMTFHVDMTKGAKRKVWSYGLAYNPITIEILSKCVT